MTISLRSSKPAASDHAIVFACDGNYLGFALHAAEQIARLAPARDFDICICSAGADPAVKPALADRNIRTCRVDTGDIFRGLYVDARRTDAAYLRLALPAAFAGQYRRLLYLDADIFVQRGDFAALLRLGLGGHAVAAVRDNSQWRTPTRRPDQFRLEGLANAPYFNSGVLLIDVEAWTAGNVLERCLAFGARSRGGMKRLDQDLLNCVLHGDWAELSPAWNWQYTWASRLFEAMEDANIVHFIGPRKPWNHDGGEFPLRFRRAYRAFLAAHLQDAPPIGPDGVPPHRNRRFLRRMLVKHLLSTGKLCDYLDRFEDDLSIVT